MCVMKVGQVRIAQSLGFQMIALARAWALRASVCVTGTLAVTTVQSHDALETARTMDCALMESVYAKRPTPGRTALLADA